MLFVFLDRRPHFIGFLREEGPLLLSSSGRRLVDFFYLCPKLCWGLAGVSFYVPTSTWRAGRLDQVILLVWPYVRTYINFSIYKGFMNSVDKGCKKEKQPMKR